MKTKKINLSEKVLNSYGKAIIFQLLENNNKGESKQVIKEMTVLDVIVIALQNTINSTDENFLYNISEINTKLINLSIKNDNILKISNANELKFLCDLIKNDSQLSNLIKSFTLSKISL